VIFCSTYVCMKVIAIRACWLSEHFRLGISRPSLRGLSQFPFPQKVIASIVTNKQTKSCITCKPSCAAKSTCSRWLLVGHILQHPAAYQQWQGCPTVFTSLEIFARCAASEHHGQQRRYVPCGSPLCCSFGQNLVSDLPTSH